MTKASIFRRKLLSVRTSKAPATNKLWTVPEENYGVKTNLKTFFGIIRSSSIKAVFQNLKFTLKCF